MTISIANATSQVGTAVTSITAPNISTTTGNWLVADVSSYNNPSGYSSMTSTGGTTGAWADSIAEVTTTGAANKTRQVYAQISAGNASHAVTYNASGSTDYPSMVLWELSGLNDADPLGEVNSGVDSASPYTLDLVIPDANERLLLSFAACNAAVAETVTQTGSFTEDKNIGVSGASEMLLGSHLASTSASTKTLSCTTNNGNEAYGLGIRAFKAASQPETDSIYKIRQVQPAMAWRQ